MCQWFGVSARRQASTAAIEALFRTGKIGVLPIARECAMEYAIWALSVMQEEA